MANKKQITLHPSLRRNDAPEGSTALARRGDPDAWQDIEPSLGGEAIRALTDSFGAVWAGVFYSAYNKLGILPTSRDYRPGEAAVVDIAFSRLQEIEEQAHDNDYRRDVVDVVGRQVVNLLSRTRRGFDNNNPKLQDNEPPVAAQYFAKFIDENPGFDSMNDPVLSNFIDEVQEDLNATNIAAAVEEAVSHLIEFDRYEYLANLKKELFEGDGEITIFEIPFTTFLLGLPVMQKSAFAWLARSAFRRSQDGTRNIKVILTRLRGSEALSVVVRGGGGFLNDLGQNPELEYVDSSGAIQMLSDNRLFRSVMRTLGIKGRVEGGEIILTQSQRTGGGTRVRMPIIGAFPESETKQGGAGVFLDALQDALDLLQEIAELDDASEEMKRMARLRNEMKEKEQKKLTRQITADVLYSAPRAAAVEFEIRRLASEYLDIDQVRLTKQKAEEIKQEAQSRLRIRQKERIDEVSDLMRPAPIVKVEKKQKGPGLLSRLGAAMRRLDYSRVETPKDANPDDES